MYNIKLQNLFKQLEFFYVLQNETEIFDFLNKNQPLVSLQFLEEVHSRLKTYFPDGECRLEVVTGSDEGEAKLKISIYLVGDVSAILSKYNQFKKEWWIAAYNRVNRKVTIVVMHPDLSPTGDAWNILRQLVGTVEAPEDWATEHNHYLYGTPKRQNA